MPRHNAPLFLRSAAHVPRRPAPPSLLRSTVSSSTRTLPIRTIAGLRVTRVITCVDLGRYGKRIEGRRKRRKRRRREKARERKHGGRKRRGCRNRNRNRPTFTFTSLCRLFHSFHSRISLSRPRPWPRDSRRDRPRCFFSPLPSFSPRRPSQPLDSADREKINQLGPAEQKHALFQFSNLHAFLCKHFQGGSRRRKRSLLASNTNTLTMNHRDHRIRPLLPVRG